MDVLLTVSAGGRREYAKHTSIPGLLTSHKNPVDFDTLIPSRKARIGRAHPVKPFTEDIRHSHFSRQNRPRKKG